MTAPRDEHQPAAHGQDDWRLTGQERFLHGAALAWQPYRAYSATWDHDHCAFCWTKFMDPGSSDAHRRFVETNADVLTEGFATTAEHADGAAYHWICRPCFDCFADRFQWRIVPPS